MLFASTSLAARIERAECRLLADGAAAGDTAPPRHAVSSRCRSPGGIATFTGEGSPLNKVAGLGFAGPLDEGELAAVERAFAERGVAGAGASCPASATPRSGPLLTRRGYTLQGFENVLGRALPVEPAAAAGGRRDRAEPGERAARRGSTWS